MVLVSDYSLAYETSKDNIFNVSQFTEVYSFIAGIYCIFVVVVSFVAAFLCLKIAQRFLDQILDSILHSSMSLFDITPSGRTLSRVSPALDTDSY
ncbi:hypothetical protein T459_00485 [Capsicum annuum]|uniref:ABC transmembrane type-1 domain-containing protein n=1 Tax=Capsicum annuum TaxID=4072 RepID=A0A2G3AEI3_CAPAN|nr:hypothetical protein FXO37_36398 [Capsicum annuum]PHT92603.1 hypothetical protein T459_00485 [Capsicum annuum]